MVVGGEFFEVSMNMEECVLKSGQFTCTSLSAALYDYSFDPILFLVSDEYANC